MQFSKNKILTLFALFLMLTLASPLIALQAVQNGNKPIPE